MNKYIMKWIKDIIKKLKDYFVKKFEFLKILFIDDKKSIQKYDFDYG